MARPRLSPTQIRMARAALQLTQRELAKLVGVSHTTLIGIEREKGDARTGTLVALQTYFEDAGIEFVGDYGVFDRRHKQDG